MPSVLFIDAYSQIYRMFFAIRGLSDPSGAPCNAVYGMARLLQQLHEHYPTEYGALVFDKGKCSRRTALHPLYKAQRPPMPPQLRSQVGPIRQWAAAFGWRLVEREGVEADDLICGMTHECLPCDELILTSDKDIAQLTALEGVRILSRESGRIPWSADGADAVKRKFGVPPEQLRDYLALIGDTADNIPGLGGCGPKTAARLLSEFGSIDGVYASLQQVKPAKLQEALAAQRAALERNRSLIALDRALPEDWRGMDGIRRNAPDWRELKKLSEDFGFKSMAGFIAAGASASSGVSAAPAAPSAPRQLTFF